MCLPELPLKLNKSNEGDSILLRILTDPKNFTYLREKSRKIISKINLSKNKKNLLAFHKQLIQLWPEILIDAILNLKKKDPREYDKKNKEMDTFFDEQSLGTDDLKEVLTGFSEFEGMMYGASPDRYRDHVVHSFRVWIIGHTILKKGLKGKFYCEAKNLQITQKEWECMWAIVALCHDIGYPLSEIEKINMKARNTLRKQGLIHEGDLSFTFSQQMLPFHDTIIKLMASNPVASGKPGKYLTHLQNKYYLKLLKSFDRLDHGIVSSLVISSSLVYFLESDLSHDNWKPLSKEDARQFLIRREILRAIAAHTCQDIYHLRFDTLSFLLYIVDEIQCWGRPTLEQLQHEPSDIMGAEAVVKKINGRNVDVEILTDDENWNEDQIKHIKKQIGKLRRMLRLAVGTFELEKSFLSFKVKNKSGQYCSLLLKNGGISLSSSGKSSPDNHKNLIKKHPVLEKVVAK